MNRNLNWLNMPEFMRLPSTQPLFPKKFRVTTDVAGFSPRSIKTEVSNDKKRLVVSGKEGEPKKTAEEDYSVREFRKSYNLPENVDTNQLVSFVTANDKLVVEIPYKETTQGENLFPQVVEGEGGKKQVSFDLHLPENIDPSKIKVTCKDRDLIVQAEHKQEQPDSYSQTSFFSRTTLPEATDFKQLKCLFDKHKLSVCAPVVPELETSQRNIPIELGGEMIEHAQQPSSEKTVQQPQQQQQSQTKTNEPQNIPVQREA